MELGSAAQSKGSGEENPLAPPFGSLNSLRLKDWSDRSFQAEHARADRAPFAPSAARIGEVFLAAHLGPKSSHGGITHRLRTSGQNEAGRRLLR